MDILRELFKNKEKKTIYNLILAFCIGILLIVLSNTVLKPAPAGVKKAEDNEYKPEAVITTYDGYEEKLEKKLEAAIGKVEGVGAVKVMITLSYGREIVVAQDVVLDQSTTKEEDGDGGKREINSIKKEDKAIILNNDSPLVIKEIRPKIEGIIIVAEGGGNPEIKQSLIKVAKALFNVEAHKIEILKMNKGGYINVQN